jgi:hypothetical protein
MVYSFKEFRELYEIKQLHPIPFKEYLGGHVRHKNAHSLTWKPYWKKTIKLIFINSSKNQPTVTIFVGTNLLETLVPSTKHQICKTCRH